MAHRPKEQPRLSVEEWDAQIGDFLNRYEAEEAQAKALEAERRDLALQMAAGEPEAVARVAEINARTVALGASLDMLKIALESAGEARREAAGAAQAEAEKARQREAQKTARALLEASREADAAMRALADALTRRKALAFKLQGLGHRVTRLVMPEPIARAANTYGLNVHLGIPRSPPARCIPLAEADEPLLPLASDPAKAA